MLQLLSRKNIILTAFLVPMLSLNVRSVSANTVNELEIVNKGKISILHVYFSVSGKDSWGSDILEGETLTTGTATSTTFPDGECIYDMKVEFEDGDTSMKSEIDVCHTSKYTFTD